MKNYFSAKMMLFFIELLRSIVITQHHKTQEDLERVYQEYIDKLLKQKAMIQQRLQQEFYKELSRINNLEINQSQQEMIMNQINAIELNNDLLTINIPLSDISDMQQFLTLDLLNDNNDNDDKISPPSISSTPSNASIANNMNKDKVPPNQNQQFIFQFEESVTKINIKGSKSQKQPSLFKVPPLIDLTPIDLTQIPPKSIPTPPELPPLPQPIIINKEELQRAESYKNEGNQLLKSKPLEAINFYNKAISINSHNAIYFANRAAAYTEIEKYRQAIIDWYNYVLLFL